MVYHQYKYTGLKLTHTYAEQGIENVKAWLSHIDTDMVTGQLFRWFLE